MSDVGLRRRVDRALDALGHVLELLAEADAEAYLMALARGEPWRCNRNVPRLLAGYAELARFRSDLDETPGFTGRNSRGPRR